MPSIPPLASGPRLESISILWKQQVARRTCSVREAISNGHPPGHELLYDYRFETELRSFTRTRPISQIALDLELVYLSANTRIARRFCELRQINALFADVARCYFGEVQRQKINQAASGAFQLCAALRQRRGATTARDLGYSTTSLTYTIYNLCTGPSR